MLAFAEQYCMTVLLGENLDTLRFVLSQTLNVNYFQDNLNACGTAGHEVRFWDGWQVSIIFITTQLVWHLHINLYHASELLPLADRALDSKEPTQIVSRGINTTMLD